jgi:Xaa-Pro dipeptidase
MAALPGIRLPMQPALMQGLRMVKTDAEIEKLAHICAIGSATFA